MRFIKRKPIEEGVDLGPPPIAANEEAFRDFPALFEFLTVSRWEDGTPRATGTLLLFSDAGVFKFCLNDRDAGLALWVSSSCLLGALESLERALAEGTGEWRGQATKRRK